MSPTTLTAGLSSGRSTRAETIHEQKLFREAFRKRRCIAPMNAFLPKDGSGRGYAVSRVDGQPFGVAGIWENWKNPETSQWVCTFALITVPANRLLAAIHDRMLAIIEKEDFERWFAPDDDDPRYLLMPYPAEHLSISPVLKSRSAYVNSPTRSSRTEV